MRRKKAVIFDLDQTLFDIGHRLHFVEGRRKDWDGFHGAMDGDRLNMWAFRLLWMYDQYGYDIIVMTGRSEEYRDMTRDQLMRHEIPYNMLLMRQEGDYRPSAEVKVEMFRERVEGMYSELDALYDDNVEVCEAFMGMGVTAMRVMSPGGDVTDPGQEDDMTVLDSERDDLGYCGSCGYLRMHDARCKTWLER